MNKLRTAVIGLGRAGWQMHIPQVVRHDGYDLIAVVDPLQERLEEARKEFNTRGYPDCDTLFNNEDLDFVVIASPTHFHLDQVNAAFKNGVDVLCDKPMASSLKEADQMIESMKKYGRKLMIYQPHRSYVDSVALQEILKMNLIGSIYMIKRGWTMYRIRVDWQAFQKYGGGELSNSGAHFIDQVLFLSGSRMKRFISILRKVISKGDAEDVAKIVMETENGIICDLDISMAAAYRVPPFHILGERGSIILDEEKQEWHVRFYREEDFEGIELQNTLAAFDRSYCDDQPIPWQEKVFPISDFQPIDFYGKGYEYFALDKEPFIPIEESREIMRIIDACKKDSGIYKEK
jgi:predicted dehydrogenase